MADRSKGKNTVISERIKHFRLDRGFTQKELAKLVHKSESAVRMWELGKSEPDIETINLLSEIFDVTVDSIITNNVEASKDTTPTPSPYLTEAEAALLELFRAVPPERQEMVYRMIQSALSSL